MSVKIMGLVWQNATDLAGSDLLVMLALADWANDQGVCWPSVPRLAEKARVSERTVRYILRHLTDLGYVRVEEHRGRNHTNQYLLNLQVLHSEKVQQPLQVLEPQNLQNTTQNLQNTSLKPAIAIAAKPLLDPSIEPLARPQSRPKPAKRKQQISPHFEITPELRRWAADKGIRCDLERETEKFVDYFLAKGEARADWDASWRLWIQKAAEMGGTNNGAHRQNATEVRPTEIHGPNRQGLRAALEESSPPAKHA